MTNNATVSWDATPRSTFSLTYRHRNHVITEGANITATVPLGVCPATVPQAFCGTVTINENGGIFNAALRPASNWDLNGTVEMLYDDNVFTPVAPRQTQHYRVHTLYRPKPWATISGAYNDLERHNNTNNTGTALRCSAPLGHVDHSRVVSLGADLMPNEHYGLDLNYAYSDVYTATNICFQGAATAMPGGTVVPGALHIRTAGTLCAPCRVAGHARISRHSSGRPGISRTLRHSTDRQPSPCRPVTKFHSDIGYRVSAVNGSRFFTDAQDVNGSLVSTYQSPFVNLA